MPSLAPRHTQYALRAVFELAKHRADGPVKISAIAGAQAIPVRFLEVILSRLKRSGLIDSKRGFTGGYFLTRPPGEITVGDIMRFFRREARPGGCAACLSNARCPFTRGCAFSQMWNRVDRAIFAVYNETTIQDLVECDRRLNLKKGRTRKRPLPAE
jgi:Rrf2 family protein